MSWHYWVLIGLAVWWLHFAIFGGIQLYKDYGFVMCAIVDRDRKERPSPRYVSRIDTFLSIRCVLRDGMYNAIVMPVLCLDFRPHYAFKMLTVKGVTFPFFELVTERLSRYNEQPDAWAWHKFVARTVAPFLDGKDPKKWHVCKPNSGI